MEEKYNFKGKRLYRSYTNRMIAGVCGGIAEYFEIDPTLVRIIVIALVFFGGVGILAYLAAVIIVPNNPDQTPQEGGEKIIRDKSLFWGSLLIIIGLLLMLRQLGFFYGFEFWRIPWQMVWSLFLILVGGYLLYNHVKKDKGEEDLTRILPDKKLYRSKDQKMLAGVCGGLAEYFTVDVSIIRILWTIVTLLTGGLGVLVYVLMWIIFPETPEQVNDKNIKV